MTPVDGSDRTRPGHSTRGWTIFILAALVIAVLIVIFGWLPRRRNDEKIQREAHERVQEKPRATVYVVKRAASVSELMIPGTALAYTEAYIYARASGYVTRRSVDIGDRVRKGQVLAVIDSPELDRQVAQARSALLESQSSLAEMRAQLHVNALNWDRYKVLVAKGVLSRQQGDQQEANYRVAEANVGAAENTVQGNRENLDRLIVLQGYEQVTAPFSGVITARNIDVGALISAQGGGLGTNSSSTSPGLTLAAAQANNSGTSGLSSQSSPSTGGSQGGEMFAMADVSRLRVLVSVPEAYSSAVHVGQKAMAFFQELPNSQYEGKVTRTSASIDQNTRTLLVEVQVLNPKGTLLPGMYVVVNFVSTQAARPLLVPGEAIVVRNAKQTIAVVTRNTVHFRPVVIGRDYGDETEILGGLQEGDVIVRTITDEIEDGANIDPQYPSPPKQQSAGGQSDKTPSASGQYGNQGLDNSAQKTGQQQKQK